MSFPVSSAANLRARCCCMGSSISPTILFFAFLLLACLTPALGQQDSEGPEAPFRSARVWSAFDAEGPCRMALRLKGDAGSLFCGLEGGASKALVRAGLETSPLICGPVRFSGIAALASSPTAISCPSIGSRPLTLDHALESTISGLSLGTGFGTVRLDLFVAARGMEGRLLAALPGIGATDSGDRLRIDGPRPMVPEGISAGAACFLPSTRGGLSLIFAAQERETPTKEIGWSLDARADPGGRSLLAGIFGEFRGSSRTRSSFGLAISRGTAYGTSAALRLEGKAGIGPLLLDALMSAAGRDYRGLLGEGAERALSLGLKARLALPRNAIVKLSLGASVPHLDRQAPGPGLPMLERRLDAGLSLPLGGSSFLVLEPALGFGLDAEGSAILEPSLGLKGGSRPMAWRADLAVTNVEPRSAPRIPPRVIVSFSAGDAERFASSAGWPALETNWTIDLEAGSGKAPLLDAAVMLGFGLPGEATLQVGWGFKDLRLEVLDAAEAAPGPEIRLRFKATTEF